MALDELNTVVARLAVEIGIAKDGEVYNHLKLKTNYLTNNETPQPNIPHQPRMNKSKKVK